MLTDIQADQFNTNEKQTNYGVCKEKTSQLGARPRRNCTATKPSMFTLRIPCVRLSLFVRHPETVPARPRLLHPRLGLRRAASFSIITHGFHRAARSRWTDMTRKTVRNGATHRTDPSTAWRRTRPKHGAQKRLLLFRCPMQPKSAQHVHKATRWRAADFYRPQVTPLLHACSAPAQWTISISRMMGSIPPIAGSATAREHQLALEILLATPGCGHCM